VVAKTVLRTQQRGRLLRRFTDSIAVEKIQLQPLRVFVFEFRAERLSIPLCAQLVEQGLGIFQVRGVEALGEPVVDSG
jgi:hypothetical protein